MPEPDTRSAQGRGHFDRDLERFEDLFRRTGAFVVHSDGTCSVDPDKVPADAVRGYRTLLAYGAANGLI